MIEEISRSVNIPDYSKVTYFSTTSTTMPCDAWVMMIYLTSGSSNPQMKINGELVQITDAVSNGVRVYYFAGPVKKGDVITFASSGYAPYCKYWSI